MINAFDFVPTVDQKTQLGTLFDYVHPTYGQQTYRYVRVRDALAIGEGCMQENGTDPWECAISGATTPNARMAGIAQVAFADDYYGWVLKNGLGTCASDGSTTANTIQTPAANGRFTDGTAVTSENCVWAMETENPAGAGGLFLAKIAIP